MGVPIVRVRVVAVAEHFALEGMLYVIVDHVVVYNNSLRESWKNERRIVWL